MRRFGLIGRPLGHSASAAYFTEKFNREGITDCEYSLYELGSIGDLPGLLERLPELCGLNVTIPYKRDVMAFLDSVSPEAEAIGAVNCIRRTADGRLAGTHLKWPHHGCRRTPACSFPSYRSRWNRWDSGTSSCWY